MKKYKLIKEYPGSGEIGDIKTECWVYAHYFEKFPEYWEKVVEKEYQILSFKTSYGLVELDCVDNTRLKEEYFINNEHLTILSVERMSDNEVFTVGDKITNWKGFTLKIDSIYYNEHGQLSFKLDGLNAPLTGVFSQETPKAKEPLFTTEDGIEKYKGDLSGYWVRKKNFNIEETYSEIPLEPPFFTALAQLKENSAYVRFAYKLHAEEYIAMNKPCLSISDVLKVVVKLSPRLVFELKEFVKSRL